MNLTRAGDVGGGVRTVVDLGLWVYELDLGWRCREWSQDCGGFRTLDI